MEKRTLDQRTMDKRTAIFMAFAAVVFAAIFAVALAGALSADSPQRTVAPAKKGDGVSAAWNVSIAPTAESRSQAADAGSRTGGVRPNETAGDASIFNAPGGERIVNLVDQQSSVRQVDFTAQSNSDVTCALVCVANQQFPASATSAR